MTVHSGMGFTFGRWQYSQLFAHMHHSATRLWTLRVLSGFIFWLSLYKNSEEVTVMEHLTVPGTLRGRASPFISVIQAFQTRTLRHRKVSYFLQGHSVSKTEIGSRSAQLQSPTHHTPPLRHAFSQDPRRHISPGLKENSSFSSWIF